MMKNSTQHIFFDLDHTLWDFDKNSLLALEILHRSTPELSKVDFDEFYHRYKYNNRKLWDRLSKGRITIDKLKWKRLWHTLLELGFKDLDLAQKLSEEYLDILAQQSALCPNALESLEYLKSQNYTLHIITNGFEKTQRKKLETSGIAKYFESFTSSEDLGIAKPNPEIFEFALQQANASKEESVYVGDNPRSDLKGSVDFGLRCVFYNAIDPPEAYQDKCKHIRCLSQLQEIF